MQIKNLAVATHIDPSLLSRFENGCRLPTEGQLEQLSDALKLDIASLKVEWLAERIMKIVGYQPLALAALQVAESRMEYLLSPEVLKLPHIPQSLQDKLAQIDSLKDEWLGKHPLGKSQLVRMHEYFDIDYTYESNRIEGNTLTLQETSLVISQGLTIGGKSLQEHLEAINHAGAISYMRDIVAGKEKLNRRLVLELHHLILKRVDDAHAGRYRTVPVRISGSDVALPQPYLIEKLMEDYFRFYELHEKILHPVLLAADMHERLVSIHPFIDGNGRTSRLVMNFILLRNGYTRVNIKGSPESRMAYFQSLAAVQKENDPFPFYTLVADECIISLKSHLELT